MGYFSSGTEGEMYADKYCRKCIHLDGGSGPCAVWLAHLVWNYDECNKEASILHDLIPRKKPPEYGNEQCRMFIPIPPKP